MGELPTTEEQLLGEWSSTSLQASELPPASSTDPEEDIDALATALTSSTRVASPGGGSTGGGSTGPGSRTPPAELEVSRLPDAAFAPQGSPRRGARTPPFSESDISPHANSETQAAATPTNSGTARLSVLSLRDLSEIKALKMPPPPIRMLMEVCCLLFHIQPVRQPDERCQKRFRLDYWEPARRYLLSDPFFLSKLRMYDASHISPAQCNKIRRYFREPEFSAERVKNCSKAGLELYHWV